MFSQSWSETIYDIYEACLMMVLITVVAGMRRGPHHPPGQQPVDHAHHHYKPRGSGSLLEDPHVFQDVAHLKEHSYYITSNEISKMTPEEREFHYFTSHDFDKNSKLDGLELLKAIYHTLEHEDSEERSEIEPEPDEYFDGFISLVDKTLETDDSDGDGFVSYAEYRAAREKQRNEESQDQGKDRFHVIYGAAKSP